MEHHRRSKISLKRNIRLSFGPFEDTIFGCDQKMLETWQKFYLPRTVRMQVIGTITSRSHTQIVLMVCRDKKVYGYHDLSLHLVLDNAKNLFDEGIAFPGKERFHYRQRFDNMVIKKNF